MGGGCSPNDYVIIQNQGQVHRCTCFLLLGMRAQLHSALLPLSQVPFKSMLKFSPQLLLTTSVDLIPGSVFTHYTDRFASPVDQSLGPASLCFP